MRFQHPFILITTLLFGVLIGVVIDKDWLSEQQAIYFNQLQSENALLKSEREGWLSFVAEEMGSTPLYIPSEDESYSKLAFLLEEIGAEVKLIEMGVEPILEADGILISLGNEWYKEYDGPQMTLEAIPIHEIDVQNFYLSLLRVKGENYTHGHSS
ncbi:hypothetical protein BTR23_02175 [Alkalihalophilus pseudofirmus]|uniref:hypothetical protein n=1 Tax=Alkalihalobacterium alkalinitrilicum TaxID=427920 RepID=UPI00094CDF8D|nr:hypothetical protein [Alkalihalobacterium alkalinitrilicum]OLO42828.1 hypothetical protein BTR23_02175 [Alkalihalophilus pseudofirmus]